MHNKTKTTFIGILALVTAIGLYTTACTREPVYIGEILVDPGDTIVNPPDPILHPCDPDSVYFNTQLLPLLASNCALSGCHDVQSHEDGIILNNYANTRATGRISLTNPTSSKLYRVLTANGGDKMPPPPMTPFTAEQRQLLLLWIQQGALNLSCDSECDTTDVKYSTHVWPLVNTSCRGCHSGNNPGGAVSLTNYTQVKASVTDGSLMGSIRHEVGYVPMPYPAGSNKLSDCQIRTLQIWIDKGAPND